uniref:Uncharacterized protein n=2 Tax=Kalanchoe fedtschenkoi TaxID=63787 RepID=A0A7N0RF25_KALFE
MISQETDQMSGGWPLGLEIMNLRVSQAPPHLAPTPPVFLRFPSTSLTSASSSNFETESMISSSFFEDRSVTLGRLIGIRPRSTADKESKHNQEEHLNRHTKASKRGGALHSKDEAAGGSRRSCGGLAQRYDGICIPLLAGILGKMNPAAAWNKSSGKLEQPS